MGCLIIKVYFFIVNIPLWDLDGKTHLEGRTWRTVKDLSDQGHFMGRGERSEGGLACVHTSWPPNFFEGTPRWEGNCRWWEKVTNLFASFSEFYNILEKLTIRHLSMGCIFNSSNGLNSFQLQFMFNIKLVSDVQYIG